MSIIDFNQAIKEKRLSNLRDELTNSLIERFDFIANASEVELDEYESTLLSKDAINFSNLVIAANR